MKLYFRKAKESDCATLFKWANDPQVRRNAFNTRPIRYQRHLNWFNKKIKNPNTKIFILEFNKRRLPVGQIRFDRIKDRSYVVTISIDRDYRNRGMGAKGLKICTRQMFHRYGAGRVIAKIKSKNLRSIRCFKKAGFNIFKHRDNVVSMSICKESSHA